MSASHEPIAGHAGFYRRGDKVVFRFRDRRGRYVWQTADTLKAAKQQKAELEVDVKRGDYRGERSPYFAAYAREWIDSYAGRTRRGIREETRREYRAELENDAIPFFGRMRLAEIEPRDVKAYAAKVAERGVSQNTVRLALAPVRALFATALEEGLIRSNPSAGLRLFVQRDVDEPAERVKALAEEELAALLTEIPDEWLLFFEFLAQTALRIGEAIEVRWDDLDLGAGWLHVRRRFYKGRTAKPKSGKTRRIRLTPTMARALWTLRKETRAGGDDLVFVSEKGRRVDQSNLMRRVLKPAAERAALDGSVGFHTFRHTCATMLFRHGWNAVQVQKFLGHSDPGFTLRTYVHLLPEDLPQPTFLEQVTGVAVRHECDTDGTSPQPDRPNPEARNASRFHRLPARPNPAEVAATTS